MARNPNCSGVKSQHFINDKNGNFRIHKRETLVAQKLTPPCRGSGFVILSFSRRKENKKHNGGKTKKEEVYGKKRSM